MQGRDEWQQVTGKLQYIEKIDDLKFFECPVSVVSQRSWQIIKLVNETTSAENCDIIHLPFDGTILDQPSWYREAVQMVRAERNRHRREEMEKTRKG